MGTGTGAGAETRAVAEIGTGTRMGMGTGMRTVSERAEERQRKQLHKSCRRHVRNGRDFGGQRKRRRQERVGSVPVNPDNL